MKPRTRPNLPGALLRKNRLSRHLAAASFAAFATAALPAAAAAQSGANPANSCIYYGPLADMGVRRVDVGPIWVGQENPVGAVLKSTAVQIGWGEMYQCPLQGGTMVYENKILWGNPIAGLDRTYSTNVAGIGYRLSLDAGSQAISSKLFPDTKTVVIGPHTPSTPGAGGFMGSQYWVVQLEIIKTADRVGNGPLSPVPIGRVQLGGDPSKQFIAVQLGDVRILTKSCRVAASSKNLIVNLGRELRSQFRGIGSVTTSKDFQVVVNCQSSPSSDGIEKMVSLTMDATPDSSGAPGVLGIDTGTETASGVGIQVLDGEGRPVTFGQPKELGMSKDGDYLVPFKARYYQVANTVTGGKADGRATVTLTYK